MTDLSNNARAALSAFPQNTFSKPMSKKARILLNGVLDWGYQWSGKCYKSSNPSRDCYKAFIDVYTPIKFEDACHRFDMSTYITLLNKSYKPNKPDGLLDLMLLKNLEDQTWVNNSGLKSNVNKVGVLTSEKAVELYFWLTNSFLITDFTEMELNKISEISGDRYSLATIKQEADRIGDQDKHTISYLYAIVRDATSREEVLRGKEKTMESRNEERLRVLFADTGPKQQHTTPDKTAQWQRERDYIDILRDIDNDE